MGGTNAKLGGQTRETQNFSAAESTSCRPPVTSSARRKVLFASPITQWPISAMLKADAFAKSLDAELMVLKVSKPNVERSGLFRREPARQAILALEQFMQDREAACERCSYILPGELRPENLQIRQGDFVSEVVRLVSEIGVELIVLPPDRTMNGLLAADIAHAAKVPVLIAHPPRSHNVIVAATKLADLRYPVIRTAGQVGSLMGAEMVLVHNVAPLLIGGGLEGGHAMPLIRSAEQEAQSEERLQSAARDFPGCTAAVLKNSMNTAQAILDAARECDADLIVLGVLRESSRFDRILGGSVAARVATRALRSVLLTPIPMPAKASA